MSQSGSSYCQPTLMFSDIEIALTGHAQSILSMVADLSAYTDSSSSSSRSNSMSMIDDNVSANTDCNSNSNMRNSNDLFILKKSCEHILTDLSLIRQKFNQLNKLPALDEVITMSTELSAQHDNYTVKRKIEDIETVHKIDDSESEMIFTTVDSNSRIIPTKNDETYNKYFYYDDSDDDVAILPISEIDKNGWECPVCTVVNAARQRTCDACFSKRPPIIDNIKKRNSNGSKSNKKKKSIENYNYNDNSDDDDNIKKRNSNGSKSSKKKKNLEDCNNSNYDDSDDDANSKKRNSNGSKNSKKKKNIEDCNNSNYDNSDDDANSKKRNSNGSKSSKKKKNNEDCNNSNYDNSDDDANSKKRNSNGSKINKKNIEISSRSNNDNNDDDDNDDNIKKRNSTDSISNKKQNFESNNYSNYDDNDNDIASNSNNGSSNIQNNKNNDNNNNTIHNTETHNDNDHNLPPKKIRKSLQAIHKDPDISLFCSGPVSGTGPDLCTDNSVDNLGPVLGTGPDLCTDNSVDNLGPISGTGLDLGMDNSVDNLSSGEVNSTSMNIHDDGTIIIDNSRINNIDHHDVYDIEDIDNVDQHIDDSIDIDIKMINDVPDKININTHPIKGKKSKIPKPPIHIPSKAQTSLPCWICVHCTLSNNYKDRKCNCCGKFKTEKIKIKKIVEILPEPAFTYRKEPRIGTTFQVDIDMIPIAIPYVSNLSKNDDKNDKIKIDINDSNSVMEYNNEDIGNKKVYRIDGREEADNDLWEVLWLCPNTDFDNTDTVCSPISDTGCSPNTDTDTTDMGCRSNMDTDKYCNPDRNLHMDSCPITDKDKGCLPNTDNDILNMDINTDKNSISRMMTDVDNCCPSSGYTDRDNRSDDNNDINHNDNDNDNDNENNKRNNINDIDNDNGNNNENDKNNINCSKKHEGDHKDNSKDDNNNDKNRTVIKISYDNDMMNNFENNNKNENDHKHENKNKISSPTIAVSAILNLFLSNQDKLKGPKKSKLYLNNVINDTDEIIEIKNEKNLLNSNLNDNKQNLELLSFNDYINYFSDYEIQALKTLLQNNFDIKKSYIVMLDLYKSNLLFLSKDFLIFDDIKRENFRKAVLKHGENWNHVKVELHSEYSVSQLQDYYYSIWSVKYEDVCLKTLKNYEKNYEKRKTSSDIKINEKNKKSKKLYKSFDLIVSKNNDIKSTDNNKNDLNNNIIDNHSDSSYNLIHDTLPLPPGLGLPLFLPEVT